MRDRRRKITPLEEGAEHIISVIAVVFAIWVVAALLWALPDLLTKWLFG